MLEANAGQGHSPDDLAGGWARAGSIGRVNPQHDPTTLVVEHVATLPDYRRQGLIDRLLAAALDRGRARGAALADVGVLIGNDRAQRAYEKAGFRVVDELLDAEFEAAYDCAGIRALRQSI